MESVSYGIQRMFNACIQTLPTIQLLGVSFPTCLLNLTLEVRSTCSGAPINHDRWGMGRIVPARRTAVESGTALYFLGRMEVLMPKQEASTLVVEIVHVGLSRGSTTVVSTLGAMYFVVAAFTETAALGDEITTMRVAGLLLAGDAVILVAQQASCSHFAQRDDQLMSSATIVRRFRTPNPAAINTKPTSANGGSASPNSTYPATIATTGKR